MKVVGYEGSDGNPYCLKHAFDSEEAIFENSEPVRCIVCGKELERCV